MSSAQPALAEHEEKSVQDVADVHLDHARKATLLQTIVDRTIALLGQPISAVFALALIMAWIGFNTWLEQTGRQPLDPAPFDWLDLAATVAAFLMAGLILATQRRADQLATQRSQLTLELALLSEHKTAKLIALIEELRRDLPTVTDRVDHESNAMSRPVDTGSMLEEIEHRAETDKDP